MTDKGVTIEDVWRSNAGAELFNGLTRMHLRRQDGVRVYFSQRVEITKRLIGMLLDGGLVPNDMTSRVQLGRMVVEGDDI